MQQTGTLRKRRRRNLAKVNGLTTVPYDETLDNFRDRELVGNTFTQDADDGKKPFKTFTGYDTRLRFSATGMLEHRREASGVLNSRNRVTRDPNFHDYDDEVFDDADEESSYSGIGSAKPREAPQDPEERSRLLDKYGMQRLEQIIWLGATSGAFPWKWNAKEWRIDKWSPTFEKMWTVQWAFVTVQMCGLCCFQLHGFYKQISVKRTAYREVFMNSLGVLWYIWAVTFNLNMYLYKDAIRKYINTMLEFNRSYVEKYLIHLDGYTMGGRLVINIVTLTNVSQVFVAMTLYFLMPFKPWFLTSYVYPVPWYCLIPGVIQEYMNAGQVITSYVLLVWIMVAHTNTIQFWLRESHNNNDTDYTIDELRQPKNSIETYKSLMILCQVFNECMAPLAIPLVKFHLWGSLVSCGFVLVRSMNRVFIEEIPTILAYPVGVFNCSTGGLAILNMASQVFDLGCSFIDSWSRTRHKDFRRVLMSCPTLKVWTGRFYFITVSTTLTFFKMIFEFITNLVITLP